MIEPPGVPSKLVVCRAWPAWLASPVFGSCRKVPLWTRLVGSLRALVSTPMVPRWMSSAWAARCAGRFCQLMTVMVVLSFGGLVDEGLPPAGRACAGEEERERAPE